MTLKDSDYLLPGGWTMFIPSYDLDNAPWRVICYDVIEMLRARESTEFLTGHPSLDLEEWAQPVIRFSASKVARWVRCNRIIKMRPNADGNHAALKAMGTEASEPR